MFYSWTDLEKLGYEHPEDFAYEQMRRQDYERAIVTPEGVEIIRKQHLSDFKPAPSVKKKIAQCKVFPNMGMEQTETDFNSFCKKNKIQKEDIIRVSYEDGRIFLVYNKELTNED